MGITVLLLGFVMLGVHNGAAAATKRQGGSSRAEIAPGVWMPLISLGAWSNHTSWFDLGGRSGDTAYDYGDAEQRELGDAVRSAIARGVATRDELFVTTKIPCCPAEDWCSVGAGGWWQWPAVGPEKLDGPTTARTDLAKLAEHNLAVLKLDYVDLMILHFPATSNERSRECYRVLEELHRQGKARAVGVSNFDDSQLASLVASADIKPAVNQIGFGVGKPRTLWMQDLHDGRGDRAAAAIAKAKELGVQPTAYGPLGHTTGQGVDSVLRHPVVEAVAKERGVTSAQVALRFLVQQGIGVVTGGNNPLHYAQDVAVVDFELSDAEMDQLRRISAK